MVGKRCSGVGERQAGLKEFYFSGSRDKESISSSHIVGLLAYVGRKVA